MPGNDALDISQADADPFKFVRPVQTLKNAEELLRILHVEPDAVIAHDHDHFVRRLVGASDLDLSWIPGTGVLDRVGQEVHEYLFQEERIALNRWQRRPFPD